MRTRLRSLWRTAESSPTPTAVEVTVGFGSAAYSVDEGGSVSVKVILNTDPERSITIPLVTTGVGGADASDYTVVPQGLTFDSGETEQSFTFSATDDGENDDGESVRIGFGSLPDAVSEGSIDQATVSIADNDVPNVTLRFSATAITVSEGEEVSVLVRLSADPERSVVIPIAKTNQGGADDGDYTGVPESVTFNAVETEKSFTISATHDSADDDGESVRLEFTSLPEGVSVGDVGAATVSLVDDDVPSVSVSFGSSSYNVPEGESLGISVRLSADPKRTVVIPIAKSNQGGADSSDYSGLPDNVTFNSGETKLSFAFAAIQDSVDDDGESVRLEFGALPDGVSVGNPGEITLDIADDDVPTVKVSFGSSNYNVAEGNTVSISVRLSADPQRKVTIPISASEKNGASSSDYSGVPSSVTFRSGETEKSFTFSATQDSIDDDSERVRIEFNALPQSVNAGSVSNTKVDIEDDDEPELEPPPAPENLSARVNDDGTITLTWDAPNDSSITGYQILRRRPTMGEGNLRVYVENTNSTNTSFTDRDVTAGERHNYRVKAINEAGVGARSNLGRVDLD